jgi:hypothetical protein
VCKRGRSKTRGTKLDPRGPPGGGPRCVSGANSGRMWLAGRLGTQGPTRTVVPLSRSASRGRHLRSRAGAGKTLDSHCLKVRSRPGHPATGWQSRPRRAARTPKLQSWLVGRVAAASRRQPHRRRAHLPVDPHEARRQQVRPDRVLCRRRKDSPLHLCERGVLVVMQAMRAGHERRDTRRLARRHARLGLTRAPCVPASLGAFSRRGSAGRAAGAICVERVLRSRCSLEAGLGPLPGPFANP